jgi:hypothetical protein
MNMRKCGRASTKRTKSTVERLDTQILTRNGYRQRILPAGQPAGERQEHLRKQQEIYLNANEPVEKAATKSFASLARMLLSSNEFLYVD